MKKVNPDGYDIYQKASEYKQTPLSNVAFIILAGTLLLVAVYIFSGYTI